MKKTICALTAMSIILILTGCNIGSSVSDNDPKSTMSEIEPTNNSDAEDHANPDISQSNNKNVEEHQPDPDLNTIKYYLFLNDRDGSKISIFNIDGIKESTINLSLSPNSEPIICSKNSLIYYTSNHGIHSIDNANFSSVVVGGEFGPFSIVGEKIYYISGERKSDGNLYSCNLDGSERNVLLTDEQIMYGKDDVIQNVSFIISDQMIYYIAKDRQSKFAGIIKEYNMISKNTRNLYSEEANIQVIGVCNNKLYYQTNARTLEHIITLFSLDLVTKERKEIADISSVSIYNDVVYYSDSNWTGIFEYDGNKARQIMEGQVSKVVALNGNIFYGFTGNEPYGLFDLNTNTAKKMNEEFYGEFLAESQNSKTGTNIVHSIM